MRKQGQGLCPWTPLEAGPPDLRESGSVFRRGADEALTTGELPPLLNTLQKSRGSGGSAPSGVQGQRPWPFFLHGSFA
jgi:hypothetical protein